MPHTTKTPKPCKTKKVAKPSKNCKLWNFWFYNFADYEYPGAGDGDEAFYEGPLGDLKVDGSVFYDFLIRILFPGIDKGYVYMEDEDGNELTQVPDDLSREVIVYFHPENIIKKMHRYLPRALLEDHYTALEECGWDVGESHKGKREVFRS
jgi:hypothetical protein